MLLVGTWYLSAQVNLLAAILALASWMSYLFLYTPMKTRTPWCTVFGAVPGAIPPLIGWAAAAGSLAPGAAVLFGLLFLWQMPHFYALSHMYAADYERGGFRMRNLDGADGCRTAWEIRLYTLLLVPVGALPTLLGLNGWLYLSGALALSGLFMACGWKAASRCQVESSRQLFLASILFLPILFTLMVATKGLI